MNSIGKELRILAAIIGLSAIGLVVLVRYTDVCRLQAVTLNGRPIAQWDRELGLSPTRHLFVQPVDSLADALLNKQGIVHVDIKYQLPNSLKIVTNSLDPVCYLLDESTGIMYGLDETGRVVALDSTITNWERPVFTGARVRALHDFCSDPRVGQLIPQIEILRQDHPNIYPLIEEISLANEDYLTVSMAGLFYTLRLTADKFGERFNEFERFMAGTKPATAGVSCFDLTYDDMIVRVGYVEKKKPEQFDTSLVNDKADFSDETETAPVLTEEQQETPTQPDPPAAKLADVEASKSQNPPVAMKKTDKVAAASDVKKPGKPVKGTKAVKATKTGTKVAGPAHAQKSSVKATKPTTKGSVKKSPSKSSTATAAKTPAKTKLTPASKPLGKAPLSVKPKSTEQKAVKKTTGHG